MDVALLLMTIPLALASVAADVTLFFLTIRMLSRVSSARWIRAFDAAGSQLVDGIVNAIDDRLSGPEEDISEPAALTIAAVLTLIAKVAVAALLRLATAAELQA